MAKDLLKNPRLIVMGGPEAGLDSQKRILKAFTRKGVHFMPSFLCGAMGLVSNLSEIAGKRISLFKQERTLVAHVRSVLRSALDNKNTFQQQLFRYLTATALQNGRGSGERSQLKFIKRQMRALRQFSFD
jgi:glutamate dehydrogenase/leucine dehydrogenase